MGFPARSHKLPVYKYGKKRNTVFVYVPRRRAEENVYVNVSRGKQFTRPHARFVRSTQSQRNTRDCYLSNVSVQLLVLRRNISVYCPKHRKLQTSDVCVILKYYERYLLSVLYLLQG